MRVQDNFLGQQQRGGLDAAALSAGFPDSTAGAAPRDLRGLSRDYRRIGTLCLRHMEWTALLPVHRYSFMPSEASADGWAYVDFFDRWRDKKVPFRLIVLDSKGASSLTCR